MKKKFISVLTAVMLLSMGTTVFGAASPSTSTTEPVGTEKVAVAADAATAVTEVSGATATTATASEVQDAVNKAAAVVESAYAGYKGNVAAVIKLDNPTNVKDGVATVSITVPSIRTGVDIFILHIHDDGTYETITDVTVGAGGKITFKVTDFSTFAVVEVEKVASANTEPAYQPGTYDKYLTSTSNTAATEVTSPKTADATAFVPGMAVICLAGIVVCARKVKFN